MKILYLSLVILLIFSGTPLTGTARAQGGLHVWTASPANKIQPTTAPTTDAAITLEGARDSYEAYQVVITAGSAALSGVNLAASDLSDGSGHTLPLANVTFFREAYIDFTGVQVSEHGNVEVPQNSPTSDPRLPDPLIPLVDPYTGKPAGAPFAVAAGQNQPVWMDVYIPKDAAAGTYTGTVTVTADGQSPASIPLTLTVWNFVLPDLRVVTTYFGMQTEDFIQFHKGTWACSDTTNTNCYMDWNDQTRTVIKRYEELARAHRVETAPQFIPDPSNGCDLPQDWSAYDAAIKPYLDGSYWSDGIPSSWIPVPFTPGATWGFEKDCTPEQYTALAKAWAAHLKQIGGFDAALVYALDEPDPSAYPTIAQHSALMQAGDPDWKAHIMDTIMPTANSASTLNPALGIYAVCLSCYDGWTNDGSTAAGDVPYGRKEWPGLLSQGIKLWLYESNAQSAPYPTFATNTLLGNEPRIMMWGAWYEHASGFLMWDMTTWDTANPWGPNTLYGKTGDGVLIYPGNHDGLKAPTGSPSDVAIDGPVPSYRLKMIRAGLQDWALFTLADKAGLGDYARAQVAQAYSQMGGCTYEGCPAPENGFFWKADDALLMQVRHNIAQAIMTGKPG